MIGTTRTTQHHIRYNVSKSAATHLTTALAQELRKPGVKIRVNSYVIRHHEEFRDLIVVCFVCQIFSRDFPGRNHEYVLLVAGLIRS